MSTSLTPKVQELLDEPLEHAGISERAVNKLHDEGIHTIGALLNMKKEDFLAIRGIGATLYAEVRTKLIALLNSAEQK